MHVFRPKHIVYVSRTDAVRGIHNEHLLIKRLRETFGKTAVTVHTGKEPLIDQAAMFQRATLVIGAHGAGLSNLVFCEAQSNLLLFPMDPHVDHTYGRMAAALDIQQYVLAEVSSYYYSHYGDLTSKQLDLILETAAKIMESDQTELPFSDEYDDDEVLEGTNHYGDFYIVLDHLGGGVVCCGVRWCGGGGGGGGRW